MLINLPAQVREVLQKLSDAGFEGYIVGGCVRDSLLGEDPKDFDVCTNALPEQIKTVFSEYRTVDTGVKHGTVTVLIEKMPIECTTYRLDGKYSDGRHPDSVFFTDSLSEDLARRDFTVNAMAFNPKDGLIDLFGGQKDLFARVLRCVGDADTRFEEDGLRIMRALRFLSVLDFVPDNFTAAAIFRKTELLRAISKERIAKELILLVCGRNASAVLERYSDVFSEIIPEIKPMVGFEQHSKYHIYDVWKHTAVAVGASKPDKNVRLALLFHDIGKPSCFRQDATGAGHFSGHEEVGAEMTDKILRRLKMDNQTISTVNLLVRNHYITPVADRTSVKKLLSEIGYQNWKLLAEVLHGDNMAKRSMCFERIPIIEQMKSIADDIIESRECYTVGMLHIDGTKISELGATGRDIRRILNSLLTDVINDVIPNTSTALLQRAKEIYRNIRLGSVYYG
ncbi:MAG: CCA tRNA nucleotidyltransferase [Ruminococcus sp.]|nr:CCA tRNA nucleotidyltransferase [Ruminococcus sp.]